MNRTISSFVLWTGLVGLIVAACLGLWHWRIIWEESHPSPEVGLMIDLNPYPELLAAALNWWVPFSVLLCGVSLIPTRRSKWHRALVVGLVSHAISSIVLVTLALWLFTVFLPGQRTGVWWIYWHTYNDTTSSR